MKDLAQRVLQLERLLADGMYAVAARECVTILEFALREFIRQGTTELDPKARLAVSRAELEIGKGRTAIEEFGMGQLVGLLRASRFFDAWSASTGRDLSAVRLIDLNAVVELRNRLVHESWQASRSDAEMLFHCVKTMLETFGIHYLEDSAKERSPEPAAEAPSMEESLRPERGGRAEERKGAPAGPGARRALAGRPMLFLLLAGFLLVAVGAFGVRWYGQHRRTAQLKDLQESVVDALVQGELDAAETCLAEYREAGGNAGSVARLEESILAKRLEEAFGRRDWKRAWSLVERLGKVPGAKETASAWREKIAEARRKLAGTGITREEASLRGPVSETGARLPEGGVRAGERRVWTIRGVEFVFRWIPAGEDVIGSPGDEPCREGDERQWTAVITRGFWMGEMEVTQRQWEAVMGSNPSDPGDCPDCPVGNVSWEDAQAFVEKLNELASGGGFRLPWEAEWEYACRAGSDGPFDVPCPGYSKDNCWGRVACLDGIGWYEQNGEGKAHRVGRLKPNMWGLHDCHGNVWEWCGDWYRKEYPEGPVKDWHGPESGKKRVFRGGSWNVPAWSVRLANRGGGVPGYRHQDNGLRLVRVAR